MVFEINASHSQLAEGRLGHSAFQLGVVAARVPMPGVEQPIIPGCLITEENQALGVPVQAPNGIYLRWKSKVSQGTMRGQFAGELREDIVGLVEGKEHRCRRLVGGGGWAWHFDGFAEITPARESPGIGESGALDRLDGLDHAAVLPFQENAGPICFFGEGKAGALGVQAGVALDELVLRHFKALSDGQDLRWGHVHITRPAAAVSAALASVVGIMARNQKGNWV